MTCVPHVPPDRENIHAVLIVASDFETTSALTKIMRGLGYEFEYATDNTSAMQVVAERHFDLIVTGETTSGSDDIELLRHLRTVRPHTRLIILTNETTPDVVISAMRERAFSYFSKPFSFDSLTQMINAALRDPCWDDGIEVLSAMPAWVRLSARGDSRTADRLVQFVTEIIDLPTDEKRDVAFAFRELVLNAVQYGTRFDPNEFVEVSYVRAKHLVSCRVKDSGEGFSLDELYHAAISNPPDNPIRHAMYREAASLRPGGYGILLAQHMVDELIYGEFGNDVLLIKYLDQPASFPTA